MASTFLASSRRAPLVALVLALPLLGFAAVAAAGDLAPPAGGGARAWALILNGDDSFTHRRNAEVAVTALRTLGYRGQNIVLVADSAPAADLRRHDATKSGWQLALAELGREFRPGDTLVVYLTGHGSRRPGESLIALRKGFLGAREVLSALDRLPYGRLILVADQCYSGGFVEAASRSARAVVAVSSTDESHKTRCEPFARPFWYAAADRRSDLNGDGTVSVDEAFEVAREAVQIGRDSVPEKERKGLVFAPRYVASGGANGAIVHFI